MSLCKYGWHPFFIQNRNMKTNNQKSQKSKVKNSTDESIDFQRRRKLLALQGKVT